MKYMIVEVGQSRGAVLFTDNFSFREMSRGQCVSSNGWVSVTPTGEVQVEGGQSKPGDVALLRNALVAN